MGSSGKWGWLGVGSGVCGGGGVGGLLGGVKGSRGLTAVLRCCWVVLLGDSRSVLLLQLQLQLAVLQLQLLLVSQWQLSEGELQDCLESVAAGVGPGGLGV